MSRLSYYLTSLPTFVLGVRNWPEVLAALSTRSAHEPFTVELRRSRCRFRVRTLMDLWILKETCLDRDYEKASIELKDGWIIVDIGAGVGDFTIYAATQCPESMIYAFEPFPGSFSLLEENVALNRAANVRVFPEAVSGNGAGSVTIYVGAKEAVQHRAVAERGATSDFIEVPSTTLDGIFERFDLQRCDFLKIDCEGSEYDILFGASDQTLGKIAHICLEYHDGLSQYTHLDLVRFFTERGFRVRTKPNQVYSHLGFLYASRG